MSTNSATTYQEALSRANSSASGSSNWPVVFAGFTARGIPEDEIHPGENILTFAAWRALGRTVRRGERGVAVRTWVPIAAQVDPETGAERRPAGKRPKVAYVFHESQTDPWTPGSRGPEVTS